MMDSDANLEFIVEKEQAVHWGTMLLPTAPCFTQSLLEQLSSFFADSTDASGATFKVLRSGKANVFNLGGDLAQFITLIEQQDESALRVYAHQCIDVVYKMLHGAEHNTTSIALVQGSAFGGGMECALAADVVIAEAHAEFSLPEVNFNLYPGMGAFSILHRQVPQRTLYDMVISGKRYTAAQLHALGVIDLVVERGAGEQAVKNWIKRAQTKSQAHAALQQYKLMQNPIASGELTEVVNKWVSAAFDLTVRDLGIMKRLVRAQQHAYYSGAT
ncbi:enoyl-CoA hydratase [Pseudoalteromonas citrea]|uniref:Enoyl-CoA hydratase n=1 Tax=Pseudoalteromonas citrea TaxID=43655 RepID=A0A5S3XRP8_9GAMM|nr:crotonase/enoyl-CoA hydratase family protein [Pseudoalteromonas citrea]TMP41788.1 enoyl-CoA hydratase [Pseudoalteromonas citrea]TMP60565.1 enoyl-CoA hydratase [Pseudoalteromonas citrea]